MAKKGLKRGLEHLFEDNDSARLDETLGDENLVELISVSDIEPNPYQPRKKFDENKLNELAESIKINGVFQPILVRKNIIGYEIIAGERRLRASIIANLTEIPAIVYEFDDTQMMEISIIENIQREDLSIVEEAYSFKKLIDELEYTQEKLSNRLGISRSHIANLVRITNLEENMLDALERKEITLGHAKILVGIQEEEIRSLLYKQIIKEHLTVRETEKVLAELDLKPKKKKKKTKSVSHFNKVEEIMVRKLSTRVQITGQEKGQIKINYESEEDLERLLEIMKIVEE